MSTSLGHLFLNFSADQLLAVNLSQAHSKSIFLGEKVVFLSSKWLPLQGIDVSFAFSSGYIYILNYYK